MEEGAIGDLMDIVIAICVLGCLSVAAGAVFLYKYNVRCIYRRLDKMLSDAMEGVFTEQSFDEKVHSALESKWGHYLSAAEYTAKRQAGEKETIKTLISDISHQTKTPIANISLYSELLLEQELPKEARQYAESLNEQTKKLNFLITTLVKMSRLETGILTLQPKEGVVEDLLQKIYQEMLPKAEEKGLKLILERRTGDSHTAIFDEKWTVEAVSNIVDNAVKYTAQGSVAMSVHPFEFFCCIRIEDTGMGISEEEQSKIFSRFYRSAAAGNSEGVGIGLYLAREILSGQGGYIKVSSQIGKGSVFSIYLPR